MVINGKGEILLQKRSLSKDVQPGKWDTSVGGHVNMGETYLEAAIRETGEELGIELENPLLMYEYLLTNTVESEWIRSYCIVHEGPIDPCPDEIDETKYMSISEIENDDSSSYTPNFLEELRFFKKWILVSSRIHAACMKSEN